MKVLNRNHLKYIALITMLIDHIGAIFFPNIKIFRIIGRISFPIFAFFIAEGFFYTKNRKKYFVTILLFALITQPIYYFAFNTYRLNILFTFILAIILMYLIENINKSKFLNSIFLIIILLFIFILDIVDLFNYGFFGILIVTIFYFFRNTNIKYLLVVLCLVALSIPSSTIQLFSILSIPLLLMYNGNKGKNIFNAKYLFYVFYPLHLLILFLIKTFI